MTLRLVKDGEAQESAEMAEARKSAAEQVASGSFVLYSVRDGVESLTFCGADVEMLLILEKRLDASVREALDL